MGGIEGADSLSELEQAVGARADDPAFEERLRQAVAGERRRTEELTWGGGRPMSRPPTSRARAAEALRRQLIVGNRFTDPDVGIDVKELLSWSARVSAIVDRLAGTLGNPVRNSVLTAIGSANAPADENALTVLRLNVAGVSDDDLAEELGLSPKLISRLQEGAPCELEPASLIADRFGLRFTELFEVRDYDGDEVGVRSIAGLRRALRLG